MKILKAVIENPKQMPDWMTTEIMSLLPKSD
jgi:hypothetical protein